MKLRICDLLVTLVISAALAEITLAQTTSTTAMATSQTVGSQPPLQVINIKIGTDYYPMLDRQSPVITADSADFPQTAGEQAQRRNRRREETKARGQIHSRVVIVDDAQWIKVTLRNPETKPIRTIDWDFAFPRYENGQLLLRYEVSSTVEIGPGKKKTIKQQLPSGAKKCQVINASVTPSQSDGGASLEAICGPGFHDPSQLKEKQETVSIRRIAYADGSVWQRQ